MQKIANDIYCHNVSYRQWTIQSKTTSEELQLYRKLIVYFSSGRCGWSEFSSAAGDGRPIREVELRSDGDSSDCSIIRGTVLLVSLKILCAVLEMKKLSLYIIEENSFLTDHTPLLGEQTNFEPEVTYFRYSEVENLNFTVCKLKI